VGRRACRLNLRSVALQLYGCGAGVDSSGTAGASEGRPNRDLSHRTAARQTTHAGRREREQSRRLQRPTLHRRERRFSRTNLLLGLV